MKNKNLFKHLASILAIILILQYISVLIPFFNVNAESMETSCENGIEWKYFVDSDGNATDLVFSNENTSGALNSTLQIPEEINSHPVIGIGYNAFTKFSNDQKKSVTKIIIPKGITKIGLSSFNILTSLETVEINDNNLTYKDEAGVVFSKDGTSLLLYPAGKAEENYEIPEGVTSIENDTFTNCSKLKNITIPSTVTNIGTNVFTECSNLESINVNNNNKNYKSSDGVLFDVDVKTLIKYPEGKKADKYVIPKTVTDILTGALNATTNPSKIITTRRITNIGNSNLNNITLVCEENSAVYNWAKNKKNTELLINAIFEDENLYTKVKEVLNANVIDEYNENLELVIDGEGLSGLDISNKDITSVKGIGNLTNITELDASNNKISDISPLDNLDIQNLNLANQTIDVSILKKENDIPNILLKADETKYANGQEVTLTEKNVTVNDNKMTVDNSFGFDNPATITVNNGVANGTVCTITPSNNITAKIKMNGNIMEIVAYDGEKVLNSQDIDLYYCINDENNAEYKKYTEQIVLPEGENNVKVKFFNKEILNENVATNINIVAIRKNNMISLYANGSTDKKIQYSITGESDFKEYTEPFEEANAETVDVKLEGEENANKIEVQEIKDDEINIQDIRTKIDMFGSNTTTRAIRKNGKVTIDIPSETSTEYYYSFDKKNWTKVNNIEKAVVDNIDADIIYIKAERIGVGAQNSKDSIRISYYPIYNYSENKYSQIIGMYTEKNNKYVFGEDRTYSTEEIPISKDKRTQYTILDDDYDMEALDNDDIIDVTTVMGEVLILKKDGKVYKVGNSIDDLEEIEGVSNCTQIDGQFAVENSKLIKRIKYDETSNKYSYVNGAYSPNGTIEKIVSVVKNSEERPYVLYTNGKAEILSKYGGANINVADNVIDIAADGEDYYVLKYDKVIYNCENNNGVETDISSILNNKEIPVKINRYGSILTNNGNYYEISFSYSKQFASSLKEEISEGSWNSISPNENELEKYPKLAEISNISYPEKPTKTDVSKLGDYTYKNKNGEVYYRTKDEVYNYNTNSYDTEKIQENRVYEKTDDNIKITKDESMLNLNKVIINVEVPENTYTIKKPDGTTTNDNKISYEVTENGEYVFEFTNSNKDTQIRVIHVQTIQSRKETKIPKVTTLNGKIKLESDDTIEYSTDNNNWTEYTQEIEYKEPIYAKVKNDNYECSILKITMNENGELNVENTEKREIEAEILTNAIGVGGDKAINFALEVKDKTAEEPNNKKKNLFDYISDIADNIIYSFSSTDGKYAGCYFEKNVTEITYKDMDNNSKGFNNEYYIKNNSNIEYSVVYTTTQQVYQKQDSEEQGEEEQYSEEQEKAKIEKGEIISYESSAYAGQSTWKETISKYAYIDSTGDIISNIDEVNKVKDEIKKKNENIKFTKIVGDGITFYILTEKGEVYIVTTSDNGTWTYLLDKLDIDYDAEILGNYSSNADANNHQYIISKLNTRNIVNIYDSATALTKDGKLVSLIKDNEYDNSVIQELQKQTDKYLINSHLGIKDGKLYNFDDVQEGVEVTAGKLIKSNEKTIGTYKQDNESIKLFANEYNASQSTLAEGEFYIDVEPTEDELPEFTDIAEYREGYLAMLISSYEGRVLPDSLKHERVISDYSSTDQYGLCYALAKNGEIWLYLRGCVIDTGINLDFFGPTMNYSLSTTKWTNQNINLLFTENTTNNIKVRSIKKDNETISNDSNATIEGNGTYNIEIEDTKGRSYTTTLDVVNIDKVNPVVEIDGEIVKNEATLNAHDVEDTTGLYAKSGIGKIQITFEKPTEETKWEDLEDELNTKDRIDIEIPNQNEESLQNISYTKSIDNEGNVIIKLKNGLGNTEEKTVYVRTIDNAGNIGNTIEVVLPPISTGKVIVKYQDIEGNTIAEDKTLIGEVDQDYKTEKIQIDGYEFVETVGIEEGKFKKEDQVVIYKYKKISTVEQKTETETGKVIIKYQDMQGNSIKDDITISGNVGESYKSEKAEIYKYKLVEVVGNEEGIFTKEDQVVIYKYDKVSGIVIIKYIDPDGNEITEDKTIMGKVDDPYHIDRLQIDGYKLIEVIGNEEGVYTIEDQTVMFKYKKIEQLTIPQTGQARIIYIILGIIILVTLIILNIYAVSNKKKDNNK